MASLQLTTQDFVHLHNHTQYSLLDGLTKVPDLVEYVKTHGMSAVAVTDHGTLSGAIEFYKAALADDINPLIGMETYVAARSHTDRDPSKDKTSYHLILIAMNNVGYQNLMRLSTLANLEGFYYRPRIDKKLLKTYSEGLIALSGCLSGEIGDLLRREQYKQAKEIAMWYKGVFGDRYYLEIQDHGHPEHPSRWPEQTTVNEQTLRLGKELNIQCVLTSDAHYLKHADQEAHEILLCVQTGSYLSDQNRMSLKNFELHVTDPKDLISRWGNTHPELITNTKAVADRCHVEIVLGEYRIPQFSVPSGQTEKSYLDYLTYSGLITRYADVRKKNHSVSKIKKELPSEIVERAEYELGVIDRMGFNGYFLIVQDFINWGKNEGIVFGPGRGSGAGSIVAYALRITELDPLAYDLLFERFLNPDRISMPDFDIDIQDSRRDEVIRYCVEKYGSDRVANIVTFGRMAARNAVRDVARVLQVPYAEADRLAKMIPPPVQGRHIPLSRSLQDNNELKQEYQSNESSRQVFDLAMQLEGTIRSHGVHAAGVVIAPDEIVKFVPLEMAQKGVIATQYSMGPIEDLGLLKMDFLGLSNLTIIKNTLRIVKKVHGKTIDINTIPLNDMPTYELLTRGDTTGVFQLESAGMKRYLKDLRPTVFEDIISMVALYRPGPMQWIDDFIDRKHGRKAIEYLHPAMEPALKSTYGVIVTQEQVMQISKEMCGFSGGQADTLRKAIGKKIPEVMKKLKSEFIEGAIKTVGADRALMEKLWQQLEEFAAYCFNKAHSACYAMIAYWTAYLKANYPAAFMAALMTSDYDNVDRLAIEITECKHMGIEVLAPDVNESFLEFAVVSGKQQIRFGMAAIKNVGTGAVEEILRARSGGTFESLEDFLQRVSVRVVNRKALESLIKAGALDRFGARSVLLASIDTLLAFATKTQKQAASGQTDLFGGETQENGSAMRLVLDVQAEVNERDLLNWERELLGIYLSSHPLAEYQQLLEDIATPLQNLTRSHDGKAVCLGGVISEIREITTKNGQRMAFVKLEDHTGEIEIILFPKQFAVQPDLWQRDRIILLNGKVTARDKQGNRSGELKVLVDDVREITLEEAQAHRPGQKNTNPKDTDAPKLETADKKLYVRLGDSSNQDLLIQLKSALDEFRGETDVVLVLGEDKTAQQVIKLPMKVAATDHTLKYLSGLLGAANVKLS